jgi:hypothetical protein
LILHERWKVEMHRIGMAKLRAAGLIDPRHVADH